MGPPLPETWKVWETAQLNAPLGISYCDSIIFMINSPYSTRKGPLLAKINQRHALNFAAYLTKSSINFIFQSITSRLKKTGALRPYHRITPVNFKISGRLRHPTFTDKRDSKRMNDRGNAPHLFWEVGMYSIFGGGELLPCGHNRPSATSSFLTNCIAPNLVTAPILQPLRALISQLFLDVHFTYSKITTNHICNKYTIDRPQTGAVTHIVRAGL